MLWCIAHSYLGRSHSLLFTEWSQLQHYLELVRNADQGAHPGPSEPESFFLTRSLGYLYARQSLRNPALAYFNTWVLFLFLSVCFQNVCLTFSKMYPHEVNIAFSKYSLGKELTTAVSKVNERCIIFETRVSKYNNWI